MKKTLSIVESAYRATIEEQDDTVLWFNHALRNAGAEISILLTRNSVNYAISGHKPERVSLGGSAELRPPAIDHDLSKMISANVPVYVLQEDVWERGIAEKELIPGIQKVSREDLPLMFDQFDQIFHW